jgi:SAM-dependent methyltransferase
MGEIFRRERAVVALPWTGERCTGATSGQVEIEHVHRYLLAREFCQAKDVLDVASGEGYGAALLSQVARSVIGVELDAASVEHAQSAYGRANLRFCVGDARSMPLAEHSIDVVVSIETLEHFAEHETFLDEIQRVLRPNGLLILSSPDRDFYYPPGAPPNPYHVRELSSEELAATLSQRFKHLRLYGQRALMGSAIVPLQRDGGFGSETTFDRHGENQFERSVALPRPVYAIALASDQRIEPELATSLYVETSLIDEALKAHCRQVLQQYETDLVAARAAADSQRNKLDCELQSRAEELASGAVREATWRREAQRLLAELRQVRASRSWWITAPARKLWRAIRRAVRRLRSKN